MGKQRKLVKSVGLVDASGNKIGGDKGEDNLPYQEFQSAVSQVTPENFIGYFLAYTNEETNKIVIQTSINEMVSWLAAVTLKESPTPYESAILHAIASRMNDTVMERMKDEQKGIEDAKIDTDDK